MNVVTFYLLVAAVLGSVFLFFKPMKVPTAETGELAQMELSRFVVHEVTPEGVKTILGGSRGLRYEDRYEVKDLNLTDRAEGHIENMRADNGVYREPMIHLRKAVRYKRDDGVRFETEALDYNRSAGKIWTTGPFVLWQARDKMTGRDLFYDTVSGEITAKAVSGNYEVKDAN